MRFPNGEIKRRYSKYEHSRLTKLDSAFFIGILQHLTYHNFSVIRRCKVCICHFSQHKSKLLIKRNVQSFGISYNDKLRHDWTTRNHTRTTITGGDSRLYALSLAPAEERYCDFLQTASSMEVFSKYSIRFLYRVFDYHRTNQL